jgi:RimJ/RimL family protein N-acetyltransferase
MIDYGFGVSLRPLSDIEPDKIREWRNNPAIFKWSRQHSPLEKSEHRDWLESLAKRKDIKMLSIFHKDDPVGVCGFSGIDFINRHAEFSIYIGPESWGKRSGKAALQTLIKYGFDVLGFNHIFGETFEGNHARLTFEHCGFKWAGTRKQFYYREGKFIDAHIYELCLEDFKK